LASRLVGRTAIVFGGGHAGEGPHGVHGIGFACAATFAGEGANVVVVDRGGAAARHARRQSTSAADGRSVWSPTCSRHF
jgi:NAD(P)-dependent dehydrogenase (short-subunit alcohol dehydrogenase family)